MSENIFAWLPQSAQDKEELIRLSKEFTQIDSSPRLLCKQDIKSYIDNTLSTVHNMDIEENLKKDENLLKTVIKIYLVAEYLDVMTGWIPNKAGQRLIKNANIWPPEKTHSWLTVWWKYEPAYFLRDSSFFNSICYDNICNIIGSDSYRWRKFTYC